MLSLRVWNRRLIWGMWETVSKDSGNFAAITALRELKERALSDEDMKFVAETLDKQERGEILTRHDILRISDLLKE